MEAYWLNVGSLLLGCIAWGIPIASVMFHKKTDFKAKVIASMVSLSSCAISLCMQIFYATYLVNKGDWTALMDTSNAVAFVSLVLLVVTIILNTILLFFCFHKN